MENSLNRQCFFILDSCRWRSCNLFCKHQWVHSCVWVLVRSRCFFTSAVSWVDFVWGSRLLSGRAWKNIIYQSSILVWRLKYSQQHQTISGSCRRFAASCLYFFQMVGSTSPGPPHLLFFYYHPHPPLLFFKGYCSLESSFHFITLCYNLLSEGVKPTGYYSIKE